jgi:hypothetical protein
MLFKNNKTKKKLIFTSLGEIHLSNQSVIDLIISFKMHQSVIFSNKVMKINNVNLQLFTPF